MQRHLFLTGPSGSGKSSLICSALGERLSYAGGLVTRPAKDDTGALIGYTLAPAAVLGGVSGLEAPRYLFFTDAGPKTDNEVYRRYGARLLQEAACYPFAVLDEIGGFELLIPQFRRALEGLLNQDLPILGVLKPPEEAELFRQYLGIGERFTLQYQRLRQALCDDPDTGIVELREPGDPDARQAVASWITQYLL